MTENRQVAVAAVLLVPSVVVAMLLVFTAANTLSSFPFFVAGALLSIAGVLLYFLLPVAIFLGLAKLGQRRLQFHPVSIAVFAAGALLCAAWIISSWSYGERHQGYGSTVFLATLNATTAVLLGTLLFMGRRRPTFRNKIAFDWLVLLWLFSWAFPYLGEYP